MCNYTYHRFMHPAENCSNVGLDRVVRCLEWFYLIYVYCQVVGSSWTVLYCWTAGLVVDWVAGRVNGSAACMAAAKTWRCARCVIACDGEPRALAMLSSLSISDGMVRCSSLGILRTITAGGRHG